MSAVEVTELTPERIDTLFTGHVLGQESDCDPELFGEEEMLYHRIYACIEEQSKLSDHIPSPPKILIELLNELENEDTNFNRIQNLIAEDPGLIGEVVRVVNSPMYLTRAGEITSLDKAVSLLGINGVMKVTTTVMMRNIMDMESLRYKKVIRRLWAFCLQSANSCQILGVNEDSFTNYLLGLVHEIGCVSILSLVTSSIEEVKDKSVSEIKVIQRLIKERAEWLSCLIAAEWGMPDRYLLVLNEFDRLKHGKMDSDEYEICSPSTKVLESGSLVARTYSLLKAGIIEKDGAYNFLRSMNLDDKSIDRLVSRLELAEAHLV
ncbi:MAG: HDOD domain-containing protein [Pseudomonadales bacterium]|nr:HDOD domain-containing protein [Pseudomonadales bacterium]